MDKSTHREHRARKWRLITMIAGLLLASAFWMPMVPGCNEPYVPAKEYADILKDAFAEGPSSMDNILEFCGLSCVLLLPFAIGAVLAWAALCRYFQKDRWHIAPSTLLIMIAIFACVMIPVSFAVDVGKSLQEMLEVFQVSWCVATHLLVIPPAVFVYCIWALRLRRQAFWCHAFIVCAWAISWFGFWWVRGIISGEHIYYGLHLALATGSLLLLATISEASLATGWSWWQTLWRLMTCRLRENPAMLGHCPKCEYNLHGLSKQRCPECGRKFTFDELGMTAEELGFQAVAAD